MLTANRFVEFICYSMLPSPASIDVVVAAAAAKQSKAEGIGWLDHSDIEHR